MNRRTRAAVSAWLVTASVLVVATEPSLAQAFDCPDAPIGMNVIVSDAPLITGTGGADFICAGPSDNKILGGGGSDYIYGGDGDDEIRGQGGMDILVGAAGDDRIFGNASADRIAGREGDDLIVGGKGDDVLFGGPGKDTIRGKNGDDTIMGGAGNDLLGGGRGDDTLRGGPGNDRLKGANGYDDLDGEAGRDRGDGGPLRDRCISVRRIRCELPDHEDGTGLVRNPRMISRATSGDPADGESRFPSVSDDGAVAAFVSMAENLGPTGEPEWSLVVTNLNTRKTRSIIPVLDGVPLLHGRIQDAQISGNGRYITYAVPFAGSTNQQVFLTEIDSGSTILVSASPDGLAGDFFNVEPSISADGRYIAFRSGSSNLVEGDPGFPYGVFLTDTQTGSTIRVAKPADGSLPDDEARHPTISSDGRYVAFSANAANLVPNDPGPSNDIFRTDVQTGATVMVNRTPDGGYPSNFSWQPSLSADGRYVAYIDQRGAGSFHVFVADMQTGTKKRVLPAGLDEANGHSSRPQLSADGQFVAFRSTAFNLVPNDVIGCDDIFLANLGTDEITRLSEVRWLGEEANGDSDYPAISADGSVIVFSSEATNLVDVSVPEQNVYAYRRG